MTILVIIVAAFVLAILVTLRQRRTFPPRVMIVEIEIRRKHARLHALRTVVANSFATCRLF
jgi:hypothetical protein